MVHRSLFVLLVCLFPARAELFSWHSFDANIPVSEKLEIVLHHRDRTRHELSYMDQSRVGSIVRWRARPRIIPFVGYYFQPQQATKDHWYLGQRVFAGVEVPIPISTAVRLTSRLVAERYIGTGRPDYTRVRSFLRATFGTRALAPYVQNEVSVVRQGFHSLRTTGGLRLRVSPRVSAEAGYVYDCRRTFWGGDRHAIVTSVRYQTGNR